MKTYVVIVAGGSGQRMGAPIPKQFLEVSNQAILLHTLTKFKQALPMAEFVLVLPESQLSRWKNLSQGTPFSDTKVALGGESRFDSVKSALLKIPKEGTIIAIHDAVRPLVSKETILRCLHAVHKTGASIPVVPLKDSIREFTKESSKALDRSRFCLVQTPQFFKSEIIQKAYEQGFSPSFTDDASVVEALGKTIELVDGNAENIKITTPEDLIFAEAILKSKLA